MRIEAARRLFSDASILPAASAAWREASVSHTTVVVGALQSLNR
jgi:hypothetical protein